MNRNFSKLFWDNSLDMDTRLILKMAELYRGGFNVSYVRHMRAQMKTPADILCIIRRAILWHTETVCYRPLSTKGVQCSHYPVSGFAHTIVQSVTTLSMGTASKRLADVHAFGS